MTKSPTDHTSHVYSAIVAMTAALATRGIAKGRKATTGGGGQYDFRGIDDVYNAMAPLLAEHKLCILPQVLDRTVEERQSRGGGALFYVTLRVNFDVVSAEDGSTHQVVTMGEAMDFGDKATNKAMSAAYKYMAMMLFCIPTLGVDSEVDTHEVKPRTVRNKRVPAEVPAEPEKDIITLGQELVTNASAAAAIGTEELTSFWLGLKSEEKRLLSSFYAHDYKKGCPPTLKGRASDADEDKRVVEEVDLEWSR